MLFKKSLSRGHLHYKIVVRLFLVLPILSLLTSCTTTFIPGLDRILFSNSSAKVGPLVTADGQYPVGDIEAVSENSTNESAVEAKADPGQAIDNTEASPDSGTDAESEPVTDPKEIELISASKAIDQQPRATAAKPVIAQQPKSPPEVLSGVEQKKESAEIAIEYGAVAGMVVLVGEKGQQLPATGTMITLTPKTMMGEVQAQNRPSEVHIIDMEDKQYQPRYSTIKAGDQVVFVNKDNIRHNVFSSSGSNAFDLGTYGAGLKRAVTLKEPGVVKIYCNIHSEMATFIAVGNQGLSVKADDQGRYQIDAVLPGTDEVSIWNIRGEAKQIVEVKADETIEVVDRVDTTAFSLEPHKNKFGGNYSKNSTLFEDEFY